MWIELIDLLRCPREHADSWLVLSASRTIDRHIVEGTLGCHVCGTEYQLREGVADLRVGPQAGESGGGGVAESSGAGMLAEAVPSKVELGEEAAGAVPPHAELASMLAAYANLSDAGGCIALGGGLMPVAGEIEQLTGVAVMVVNPPESPGQTVSAIRCGRTLPISGGGLRALVLDEATANGLHLPTACSRVRPGGRLVLPAATELPPDSRELARDDKWLVAERTPPRVALRRA